MEYIVAISQLALRMKDHAFTFPQIHNIVLRRATEIQKMKTIEAGKAWRDYDKQAKSPSFLRMAAKKTIRAMIRWGLLAQKKEELYAATNDLLEIGKYVSERKEPDFRRQILDNMIRNEPELSFSPSRYLIPIRDFILPVSFSAELEDLPLEEAFPRHAPIVKRVLKVNMVDFGIMSIWGQFFNFTNEFSPKIIDVEDVKQIYLTCWIASLAELDRVYKVVLENGKVALSDIQLESIGGSLKHSLAILKERNWIDIKQGMVRVKTSVFRASILGRAAKELTVTDAIMISEDDEGRGIEIRENLNPSKVFVILPRKVSEQRFNTSLMKHHQFLQRMLKSPYVWISQLRALCCRELGIQDQIFDEALTASYQKCPEKFEFSMIGGDVTRGRFRPFGKPFRLYNQTFRMLRLEDSLLD